MKNKYLIIRTDQNTGKLAVDIVDWNSNEKGFRLTSYEARNLAEQLIKKVEELNAN